MMNGKFRSAVARVFGRVVQARPLEEPQPSLRSARAAKPKPPQPPATEPAPVEPAPPAALPATFMPGELIANFEGQLKMNAKEFAVDEAQYAEILKQLGLEEFQKPKKKLSWWKFWRRRE